MGLAGILFGALGDVITGKDSRSKWADPKCWECRGNGWNHLTRNTCLCVQLAWQRARHERIEQNQAAEAEFSRVYRRRRLVDPDGAEFSSNVVVVKELTPAQKEQQAIEYKIWGVLDQRVKLAICEGRLPWCCVRTPCVCGMEHWQEYPAPPAPAADSPIYPRWKAHRDWVMSWSSP